jgi:glycosyltransferase involved in cell wall biosynthesis
MLNNQPYKILVLIKSLGLGGAERLLVDALPYLDQERFEYTFAYLLPWKDFLVPQFRETGFPIYCLGASEMGDGQLTKNGKQETKIKWLPRSLQQLTLLQSQKHFDLIHAHMPVAGILARFTGRWQGIPVIYTEHNLQERYHPLTRWFNKATYGWNECVLAVSQEVSASLARLGLDHKTRLETVLNGVPVERVRAEAANLNRLREELEIPPGHLVVGTVAVFTPKKRLQDWLEVAAQISTQREDVTFLLVGHGPEEAILRAKVQALGLTERVRMPGFRPDGRRVLGLMDVYLMCSEFEGLPIALLEAMALGKPVVATAVGGIPEVAQDGQEGFLTPVGAVDALVDYTLSLLVDSPRRQQMGQCGAEKVARDFHWKDRVHFIEQLYLEVLGAAGASVT